MAALYDGNGDRIFRLDYRKNSDYVSNKAGTAAGIGGTVDITIDLSEWLKKNRN